MGFLKKLTARIGGGTGFKALIPAAHPIDEIMNRHYPRFSQLAEAVLDCADKDKNPDAVLGHFLYEYHPLKEGVKTVADKPLSPEASANIKKMIPEVADFIDRLHIKNPREEEIGKVVRAWLEIEYGKENTDAPQKQVAAFSLFIRLGLGAGLIPYRQIPPNYILNATRRDLEHTVALELEVEPLLGTVRRVIALERYPALVAEAAYAALQKLSGEDAKVLLLTRVIKSVQVHSLIWMQASMAGGGKDGKLITFAGESKEDDEDFSEGPEPGRVPEEKKIDKGGTGQYL